MLSLFYILSFGVVFYANSKLDSFDLKEYFSGLITYFIPTNYKTLIDDYSKFDINVWLKICGIITYILGKVLIIFGGYEIIKAFRKYK